MPNQPQGTVNWISTESKNFYSAGTTFSTFACAAAVEFVWKALSKTSLFMQAEWVALILSFAIVFAYALIIPEPQGSPNAGKMRLTIAEIIFGFFNSFIVFGVALALKCM